MNDAQYQRLLRRISLLESREGLLYAKFEETATTETDTLTVTIPEHDEGEHLYGSPDGVVWEPRVDDDGDAVFPQAGDTAYVMEASDGRWVVLAWTPS